MARSDTENWVDTGCEVAPSCFSCPLPACKHDYGRGIASAKLLMRIPLIQELQSQGLSQREIAARIGTSLRGVQRSLHAVRRR